MFPADSGRETQFSQLFALIVRQLLTCLNLFQSCFTEADEAAVFFFCFFFLFKTVLSLPSSFLLSPQNVELPESFTAELKDLLEGLLQRDVSKRLGCQGQGYSTRPDTSCSLPELMTAFARIIHTHQVWVGAYPH